MTVSFKKALASVSPAVRAAFELSDEALTSAGVTHALIGGLAVNASGYHYTTDDVDFLVVEDEAFDVRASGIRSFKPGVPYRVNGVAVDLLTINDDYPEVVKEAMDAVLIEAADSDDIVIVSGGLLVWMKLNAGRSKDHAAVEGLLKGGHVDAREVRDFLEEVGDDSVIKSFERCVKAVG